VIAPSVEALTRAIDDRVPLVMGRPVVVRDGPWTIQPDLAHPGDWHGRRHVGPFTELLGPDYRTLALGMREVYGADVRVVDAIIAEPPIPEEHRHSRDGEEARARIGRLAMGIRDAHLRAEVLTVYDAWTGALGEEIDRDERHGVLHAPPDDETIAPILVVRCPSTGRCYAHPVPEECRTAEQARRWILSMGPDDPWPDVET